MLRSYKKELGGILCCPLHVCSKAGGTREVCASSASVRFLTKKKPCSEITAYGHASCKKISKTRKPKQLK